MTERKIDDLNLYLANYGGVNENLTINSMKKIRTFAEQKYNRKFTNIQQLAKFLDKDKIQAQRFLVKAFNDNLDKKKQIVKQVKKDLKKQLLGFNYDIIQPTVVRDKKLTMTLEKLGKYIKFWTKNRNGAFTIVLKSRIANVRRTLTFKHYDHFYRWYSNLMSDKEVDSAGTSENTISAEGYDLFQNCIIENIYIIAGGFSTIKAYTTTLTSSFYTYTLSSPESKSNNCFLACLDTIKSLGTDRYKFSRIRKQFNLPLDTDISIQDAYRIATGLNYNIQIIDYDINEKLDENVKYIVVRNKHYYLLDSFVENNVKDLKTKRGLLTFDFETRKTTQ